MKLYFTYRETVFILSDSSIIEDGRILIRRFFFPHSTNVHRG